MSENSSLSIANSSRHPASNPFATRWTRPGAIPFQFPAGFTAPDVLAGLDANGGQGAILGCHGSGKSTLLASLLPLLRQSGREPVPVSLHDGQRRLPHDVWQSSHAPANCVLVIDGFEQLGRWQRWSVMRACERRRCGLLVTSHRPCGLPILVHLKPQIEIVQRLVGECLPDHHGCIETQDIEIAWARHGSNIREILFDLYDVFERRRAVL
jgi:hypothetical protein